MSDFFYLNAVQGTLIPKRTLGPFITLSVKNGHKLKEVLGSRPTLRVKDDNNNCNQHFTKHDEDSN